MIAIITNRKTGEVISVDVQSITEDSHEHGAVSWARILFADGESDRLDLNESKIDIFPRLAS